MEKSQDREERQIADFTLDISVSKGPSLLIPHYVQTTQCGFADKKTFAEFLHLFPSLDVAHIGILVATVGRCPSMLLL